MARSPVGRCDELPVSDGGGGVAALTEAPLPFNP